MEGSGREVSPSCGVRAGALETRGHEREDGEELRWLPALLGGIRTCSQMHFTYILPAAFSSPSQPLPKEVACSQAAPEDVHSDLPRATGQWPFTTIPAPCSLLESQNCRAWHFDSGSRQQRGFSFYNVNCHPGNRDATELFFLSGSRYPCVCQSTNRMHTHFRPYIYTETGSITFLVLFFFLIFIFNQRE